LLPHLVLRSFDLDASTHAVKAPGISLHAYSRRLSTRCSWLRVQAPPRAARLDSILANQVIEVVQPRVTPCSGSRSCHCSYAPRRRTGECMLSVELRGRKASCVEETTRGFRSHEAGAAIARFGRCKECILDSSATFQECRVSKQRPAMHRDAYSLLAISPGLMSTMPASSIGLASSGRN